jgi:hypothetical protein
LRVHLLDEREQRFRALIDRCGSVVFEHGVHQTTIAEQLRRDRGVRADSKRALVAARRERGNQFAQPGRERRRPSHHALRELSEVLRPIGLEGEQMHDLRHRDLRRTHLTNGIGPGAAAVSVFDFT